MRFRFFLILIGALVVVATFTFPLWRPLFVSDVVDESFFGLPADLEAGFQALPPSQQTAFLAMAAENRDMALEMVRAALQADAVLSEAEQAMPTMEAAVIAKSGSFTQIDVLHDAQGTATIYQMPDNSKVLRFEDFRVSNGPDLRVVLSASVNPLTTEEVELNDLDLELGRLKGNVGNQNYEIPADVDLSLYQSVVIYCRAFNVVFSTAPLEEGV
jgi:Electron transfer DM13